MVGVWIREEVEIEVEVEVGRTLVVVVGAVGEGELLSYWFRWLRWR